MIEAGSRSDEMTYWKMQVSVIDKITGKSEWRDVRPTGSTVPYLYITEKEALETLNLCYGGPCEWARIIPADY
jgi:hypothetical protein